MKSILYAWEYGVDSGHINTFLPIAKKLRAKGCNIRILIPFTTKDFSLKLILAENEFEFLDIPSTHLKTNAGKIKIGSHAELMQQLSCFKTQNDLQHSFQSWLTLFQEEAPDLVICDLAPVALLAARQLNIPTVLFDLGFFVADASQPLPSFVDYAISSNQTVHKVAFTEAEQKAEEQLLQMVNATFSEFNFSPLEKFTDFYKANKILWLNRTELSPFTHTSNIQLSEVTSNKNSSIAPHWKLNRFESPKIFAYLRQDDPVSMTIIQSLKSHNNLDAIIYIPNCHKEIKRAYDSENLIIESLPVNIPRILEDADLIINNADADLIAQSLFAGKPLLLAPTSLEQNLNANRAVKLRAAIRLQPDATHTSVFDGIYTLLGNGFYTVSARAFVLKHQPVDAEVIADTILEIIPAKKPKYLATH